MGNAERSQGLVFGWTRGAMAVLTIGLVWFACEWLFLSHLYGMRIFAPDRAVVTADFTEMTQRLAQTVERDCLSGPTKTAYFSDYDVALPYFPLKGDALNGCRVVREVVITPLNQAELSDCGALLVYEFSPPRQGRQGMIEMKSRPPAAAKLEQWSSSDGRFAYEVDRIACNSGKVPAQ